MHLHFLLTSEENETLFGIELNLRVDRNRIYITELLGVHTYIYSNLSKGKKNTSVHIYTFCNPDWNQTLRFIIITDNYR